MQLQKMFYILLFVLTFLVPESIIAGKGKNQGVRETNRFVPDYYQKKDFVVTDDNKVYLAYGSGVIDKYTYQNNSYVKESSIGYPLLNDLSVNPPIVRYCPGCEAPVINTMLVSNGRIIVGYKVICSSDGCPPPYPTPASAYYSDDDGVIWTPLPFDWHINKIAKDNVTDKLYLFTDATLYYSADNGVTWYIVVITGPLYPYLNDFIVENNIIVGYSNPDHALWKINVTNVNSAIATSNPYDSDIEFNAITIDREYSYIYAGGELSNENYNEPYVLRSINFGNGWANVTYDLNKRLSTVADILADNAAVLVCGGEEKVYRLGDEMTWTEDSGNDNIKGGVIYLGKNLNHLVCVTKDGPSYFRNPPVLTTNTKKENPTVNHTISEWTEFGAKQKVKNILSEWEIQFDITNINVTRSELSTGIVLSTVSLDTPGVFLNDIHLIGTTLLVGTQGRGIYRSLDSGQTWSNIGLSQGLSDTVVTCFTKNENYIYAGTKSNGVYFSTDAGANWETNGSLAGAQINAIFTDNGWLYAGMSSGMWRSSNNGTTWNNINSDSTISSFTKINSKLLAGSNYGIYSSTNDGADWSQDELVGYDIRSLASGAGTAFAATNAGVFRFLDNGNPWEEFNDDIQSKDITCVSVDSPYVFIGNAYGFIGRDYIGEKRKRAEVSFFEGWNMVSLPVKTPISNLEDLFPEAQGNAYSYSNGYQNAEALSVGTGYWLKISEEFNKIMYGFEATQETINVSKGWNMIGALSDSILTSSVVQIPPGIINASYFGYEYSGYNEPNYLKPGKGYWVKVSNNGKLVLSSALSKQAREINSSLENYNSITLTDEKGRSSKMYFGKNQEENFDISHYEMPPLPPQGIFDARYSSNRMLEVINKEALQTFPIAITSAEYPLTISFNYSQSNVNAKILVDGKEVFGKTNGKVQITNPQSRLSLKVESSGEEPLPKEFALKQAYPNPFNPSTTISFDLPKNAVVTLKVFDVLGREVAVLMNNQQHEAGSHEAIFDANSFASGLYFYRISAQEINGKLFSDIKRMVLIK